MTRIFFCISEKKHRDDAQMSRDSRQLLQPTVGTKLVGGMTEGYKNMNDMGTKHK